MVWWNGLTVITLGQISGSRNKSKLPFLTKTNKTGSEGKTRPYHEHGPCVRTQQQQHSSKQQTRIHWRLKSGSYIRALISRNTKHVWVIKESCDFLRLLGNVVHITALNTADVTVWSWLFSFGSTFSNVLFPLHHSNFPIIIIFVWQRHIILFVLL